MASPASKNDVFARLEGSQQFFRDISLLEGRVARQKVLNMALRPAARHVKRVTKGVAPKGPTGNLRRSIRIKTLRGNPPAVVVRSDFKIAPHTHFHTQGTKYRGRIRVWSSLHGRKFLTTNVKTPGRHISSDLPGQLPGSTGRMIPRDFFGVAERNSSLAAKTIIVRGLERLLGR